MRDTADDARPSEAFVAHLGSPDRASLRWSLVYPPPGPRPPDAEPPAPAAGCWGRPRAPAEDLEGVAALPFGGKQRWSERRAGPPGG